MASSEATGTTVVGNSFGDTIWGRVYRLIGYFGLVSVSGSLLYGFRYDPAASPWNYAFNLGLYGLFAVPHLVMTLGGFKALAWRDAAGTPNERQVYILTTVATWGVVLVFHRPVPGFAYVLPEVVRFFGVLGFLISQLLFYEGFTFAKLDSLLGAPGAMVSHSHGPETPLFVEGQYSQVRHPMYRAALCSGLCSLLIHTNAAQLYWAALVGATFIAFIPVEETQLLAARGDEYRTYMRQTRYRLIQGIW